MQQVLQEEHMYPHISLKDAQEGVNSAWVRTLNDRCFHFSVWADPAALAARTGGSKQVQAAASELHKANDWQRDPHFCPEQHARALMGDAPKASVSSAQGGWVDGGRGRGAGGASQRGSGRGRGGPSSFAGQKRDRNDYGGQARGRGRSGRGQSKFPRTSGGRSSGGRNQQSHGEVIDTGALPASLAAEWSD